MKSKGWAARLVLIVVVMSASSWNIVIGADEPPVEQKALSEKEMAEKRMKFMLQAMDRYEVEYPGDPPQISRLHPKPLLRWSNPLTTIRDGALVAYTRGGRPDVVCEFHVHDEETFGHEFSPIRYDAMKLRRGEQTVFTAENGWFKFQDVRDAPQPADKAAQRLTQMRQIAERFTVVDWFGRNTDALQHYVLRLMPQPVYRYEEADEKVDGGMFVFAQGTNPEAILLVESFGEGKQARWRYGFAPTTTYEVTAHVGGEEGPVVWTKPRYPVFGGRSGPYLAAWYEPSPDDIDLNGLLPEPTAKSEPSGKPSSK